MAMAGLQTPQEIGSGMGSHSDRPSRYKNGGKGYSECIFSQHHLDFITTGSNMSWHSGRPGWHLNDGGGRRSWCDAKHDSDYRNEEIRHWEAPSS